MPERIACHQSADFHLPCRLGQCRQYRPALPDSPRWLTRITIEEMIRKLDTIKTISLCLLRDLTDGVITALSVVFASVRQKDHQSNLQRWLT